MLDNVTLLIFRERILHYKHLPKISLEAHIPLTRALDLFRLFLDDYRVMGCSSSDTRNKLLCSEVLHQCMQLQTESQLAIQSLSTRQTVLLFLLFFTASSVIFSLARNLNSMVLDIYTLCLEKMGVFFHLNMVPGFK